MTKRQVIMLLGVWVAIFLLLGFPREWQKIIAAVSGILIVAIAYRMGMSRTYSSPESSPESLPFTDHRTRVEDVRESVSAQTVISKNS